VLQIYQVLPGLTQDLRNCLVLTNLRLCFCSLQKEGNAPTDLLCDPELQFIPLDFLTVEAHATTLFRSVGGHSNKVKVFVGELRSLNRFEKL